MLKRYQVLLPDWLEEYIKIGAEKYGFSFSEIIRLELCFSILTQIPEIHPEYMPELSIKDILGTIQNATAEKYDKKKYKNFVSQVYFETRKPIDYRKKKMAEQSK